MAYSEHLANRIRERLAGLHGIEEKAMIGGLTFMLNDKMCIGIIKDEMMCRIDPELHQSVIQKPGCRTMDFTNKPMKGYVMVAEEGMRSESDFEYWIGLCLEFNKKAKSSKRKK
jgi:TfoX/Sxy family transcriptional regulator of competence genes